MMQLSFFPFYRKSTVSVSARALHRIFTFTIHAITGKLRDVDRREYDTAGAGRRNYKHDAVEEILKYRFKNTKLLNDALTYSSCPNSASNCQRLTLPVVMLVRKKLARVAVRHSLYKYLGCDSTIVDEKSWAAAFYPIWCVPFVPFLGEGIRDNSATGRGDEFYG